MILYCNIELQHAKKTSKSKVNFLIDVILRNDSAGCQIERFVIATTNVMSLKMICYWN